MDKQQIFEITVMYPERQGFTLLAHDLQLYLFERTNTSAKLEVHQHGRFSVMINGETVYDCLPLQTVEVRRAEILEKLNRYDLLAIPMDTGTTKNDESDDPDHIQWMNCFCSGE